MCTQAVQEERCRREGELAWLHAFWRPQGAPPPLALPRLVPAAERQGGSARWQRQEEGTRHGGWQGTQGAGQSLTRLHAKQVVCDTTVVRPSAQPSLTRERRSGGHLLRLLCPPPHTTLQPEPESEEESEEEGLASGSEEEAAADSPDVAQQAGRRSCSGAAALAQRLSSRGETWCFGGRCVCMAVCAWRFVHALLL